VRAILLIHNSDPDADAFSYPLWFHVDINVWPPPLRLLGREFDKRLTGTFELRDATDETGSGAGVLIARYVLRADDDYLRLCEYAGRERLSRDG